MRKSNLKYLLLAGMAGGLVAFTAAQEGGITGTVTPAESAAVVWTVVGSDTLKAAADATTGAFEITGVPAGDYTVTIDAADPYSDATMEVTVADGQSTDVGEIELPKGGAEGAIEGEVEGGVDGAEGAIEGGVEGGVDGAAEEATDGGVGGF